MELAEYSTWATAAQLRLLPGVDLGGIPAHPRTRTSAATRWAWLLDGRIHGRPATVHAEGRRSATDRAHPLGTLHALDALARSGTRACTVRDAAKVLLLPTNTRIAQAAREQIRTRILEPETVFTHGPRPNASASRRNGNSPEEPPRARPGPGPRREGRTHPPPAPSHGSRA
ncbi:DUF6233 domain-containing protein [Streptomyces virginiae]|uniref:DUF6233 domain-containing protein n=1 Tax=Streptomyces virginiae TaxID=1961 RepID=UPI003243859B